MPEALFGTGLFGTPLEPANKGNGKLHERFIIPPFTVLNAREGIWQERKRAWLALGIKSEIGRGENALQLSSECEEYRQGQYARTFGQDLMKGEHVLGTEGNQKNESGTSVFDPVLCELVFRWFAPHGGYVLDPFAGGSVRGIVAAKLGLKYHGIDLRAEQIAANVEQGAAIVPNNQPEWICGDSREKLDDAPCVDFIFSCPPYADLERYSDDPRDLSTMEYPKFVKAYREIIAKAAAHLIPNRFACFVVGDVRDNQGRYRNFVGDTVEAFRAAGLAYYNEAILVTMVGSLPVRVGIQFTASRKLGKTHQQVLVFVKGESEKAARACGNWPGMEAA